MSSVTIPCPKCAADLKLPDRKLLGRKGKCPKCQHRFVLEEPDEVELTLAEPEAPPAADPAPQMPAVGTSARWIPDEPAAGSAAEDVGVLGNFDFGAKSGAASAPLPNGFPGVPEPVSVPENNPFAFEPPTSAQNSAPKGDPDPFAAVSGTAGPAIVPPAAGGSDSVVNRVRGRRKKKSRWGAVALGLGSALFVAAVAGMWWQYQAQATAERELAAQQAQPAVNPAWEEQKAQMAQDNESVQQLSPTSGDTIPLQYMPFTPHLIVHLRPAEIWATERQNREFVATLGGLGVWLGDQIRTITRFEPQEIEELTFALNFGPRTSPPDVAAVVRLRSAQTPGDLQLNRFKHGGGPGQIRPDLDVRIIEADQYSYMPLDEKTFAVAPITMSNYLAEAKSYPREPSVDLAVLHAESDRQRHVTLMFDLINVDTHREFIFGTDMQQFADEFVLWFGKDVQTLSWSLHLESDQLFMETLVHPNNTSSALKVQRTMQGQLQKLPLRLQDAVRYMQPPTVGQRSMIGRFPAMMKALTLGTSANTGPTYARMVTLLPGKAAANLAAASLYTWNQSVMTDFSQQAPAVAAGPKIPETIAERLKMPILVDFRRMPLQEAIAYIADEIKTPFTINGDALKLAGMTQNMPQTYNLGEVPALQALDAILSNPDYKGTLVVVVDEASKSMQLTTRPVATEAGLPIYDTKM